MRVTVAFAGLSQEPASEFDEDLGTEVDRSGVTHPEGARYRAFEVRRDGAIAPVLRSPEEVAAEAARLAPPPTPPEEPAPPPRPGMPTPLSDRPGVATAAPMPPTSPHPGRRRA